MNHEPETVDGISFSLSAVRRIDEICDEFEAQLQAGRRPQTDDFLSGVSNDDRRRLGRELQLLQREYDADSNADASGEHDALSAADRAQTNSGDSLLSLPIDRQGYEPTAAALWPDRTSAANVQQLLRRRLMIITAVAVGGVSLDVLHKLLLFAMSQVGISTECLFVQSSFALAGAVTLLVLGSQPTLSLNLLRYTELFVLSIVTAFGIFLVQRHVRDWLSAMAQFEDVENFAVTILAMSTSLFWMTAIAGYAMAIPNSWRRCATIVTLMASVPLVVAAVVGMSIDVRSDALFTLLYQIGLWMTVAVAQAVYASHRIEVLRREALQGQKLGPYRLKRLLGRGGMGEVYLAEHDVLKRPCAVKLIRSERESDPDVLARFEREVRATAALTSCHTVEIFDYGQSQDGTFYYVMEYLPGKNLDQLVSLHHPLPLASVVRILRQICSALKEAHALGLVHRDIKPNNVIVCRRGSDEDVSKLVDFGLVRTLHLDQDMADLTRDGWLAGTPAYMSPEQIAGRDKLDARTDIYSLGCVAYFLLTGEPPLKRATAAQTLAAHLDAPVVPPAALQSDIPERLSSAVMRCLEKEPADRFRDISSFDKALAECC